MSVLKVGITGGIGSGKSVVSKVFKVIGIPVFDADTEAKQLYDTDPELKQMIIASFGETVYPQDRFDRTRMAAVVFNQPEKLKLLNSLVHPRVQIAFDSWCRNQSTAYVIKEAALMIESGSYQSLDHLILVSCPMEERIRRVIERDGSTHEDVIKRIRQQLSEEEKASYCDHTIINDGIQLVIPQVWDLHHLFQESNDSSESRKMKS